MLVWLALACNEYVVHDAPPPPVAEPPGQEIDAQGEPPSNWADCSSGFYGLYFNLPADHPDVEPAADTPPPAPNQVDWFTTDHLAFAQYDPTLDFGQNWWPVDDGLEGDPAYFAVSWTAWIRMDDGGPLSFVIGSSDDMWVDVDDETIVDRAGVRDFEPETVTSEVSLNSGVHPIRVRFAHRSGADNGFRFRVLGDTVTLCYPEFPDDEDGG